MYSSLNCLHSIRELPEGKDRDQYIPDLHIDTITIKLGNFGWNSSTTLKILSVTTASCA